jgi:hypothetical protein
MWGPYSLMGARSPDFLYWSLGPPTVFMGVWDPRLSLWEFGTPNDPHWCISGLVDLPRARGCGVSGFWGEAYPSYRTHTYLVHAHTCTHMHTRIHPLTHTQAHAHICTCTHRTHIHIYTRTHIACTRIYTHIHAYTHAHTQVIVELLGALVITHSP